MIKECASGKKLIRIYDALKEKMIVDGWEYIANNDYIITRSPDRKYHLFDSRCFRDSNNLLNKGLDDIKSFALKDGVYYFLISENGKKGLYESNGVDTHLTSIEYNDIEKRDGFIIFTKNNKKQFRNIDNNYVSKWYDDVKFDEQNPNFIYCENGSSVSVYSKRQNKIIFRYRCDEMSRISATSDSIIFLVKSNNKFGLMECKNANLSFEQPTTKELLKPTSDEITREDGISLFYLKCNRKVGVYDYTTDKFVEPHYDKIEYLYRHILAFYTENYCDIGEIGKEPLIKDCSIKELRNNNGLLSTGSKMIYIKDYKYGLIDLKTKKIYMDLIKLRGLYMNIMFLKMQVKKDFGIIENGFYL